MIEIEIYLYASLRRYRAGVSPGTAERLLLPPGSSVLDLIDSLSLPAEQVQTVFVNRRVMHVETVLQAGDRVDLFPAIAGG
ncbi:MAG: MoaD/ThiS family protein [Chloroflexia bacterium]|nr:MoaD/ThiS family protein [Chloroflexia bacterium]